MLPSPAKCHQFFDSASHSIFSAIWCWLPCPILPDADSLLSPMITLPSHSQTITQFMKSYYFPSPQMRTACSAHRMTNSRMSPSFHFLHVATPQFHDQYAAWVATELFSTSSCQKLVSGFETIACPPPLPVWGYHSWLVRPPFYKITHTLQYFSRYLLLFLCCCWSWCFRSHFSHSIWYCLNKIPYQHKILKSVYWVLT
jgi:hypothetical protein